jgi:dihydrofolate reductase
MAQVQANISMSLDGFVTGPDINAHPGLGRGGEVLHDWVWGEDSDEVLAWNLFNPAGAVVTSRKVYEDTRGWGETGFYGMPVFVVTHRAEASLTKGDTTFTFVTEGVAAAVAQARRAAGAKKVHVMGGASIIQQGLNAGVIDELHLHVAPVILGDGTPLFAHLGGPIPLERTEAVDGERAVHLRYRVVK